MANSEKVKIDIELDANGVPASAQKVASSLQDIEKRLKAMEKTSGKTKEKVVDNTQEIAKGFQNVEQVGKNLTKYLTLPLLAFGVGSVKTASDFEFAMSEVEAISGSGERAMEALTNQAKELGRTTVWSAKDSADAMKYYAMAGFDANEIMSVLPGTLALATAGGTDLALTADIISDSLTGLGLKTSDTNRLVDIFASTCSSSNTSIALMGDTMKYVSPVAGSLGIDAEDLALSIGLLGNSGIKGSQAGTALRASLTKLVKPTKESKAVMEKYGVEIQKTDDGSVDWLKTMENLRKTLGGLEPTVQANALATIFGQEAMAGMASIVNSTDKDFNSLKESIENSDGVAQDMANTMKDNLKGSIADMKSALEGSMQVIGDLLIPVLRDGAEMITKLATKFNEMPEGFQKIALGAGIAVAGLGPMLSVIGKVGSMITLAGPAFSSLAGGMGLTLSAGTALTAGLAGLAVGLVGLLAYMGSSNEMISTLQTEFGAFGTFCSYLGEFLYGTFQLTFGNIGILIKTLGKMLMALMKGDFKEVGNIWKDGWAEMEVNTAKAGSNIAMKTASATKKMREMSTDELTALQGSFETTMGNLKNVTADNIDEATSVFVDQLKGMDNETIDLLSGTSDSMALLFDGIRENMTDEQATNVFKDNLEAMARSGELSLEKLEEETKGFSDTVAMNMSNGEKQITSAFDNLFGNLENAGTRGMQSVATSMAGDIEKMNNDTFNSLQGMGGTIGSVLDGIAKDGSMSSEQMRDAIVSNIDKMGIDVNTILARVQAEKDLHFQQQEVAQLQLSDATKKTITDAESMLSSLSSTTAQNMGEVANTIGTSIQEMDINSFNALQGMGGNWAQLFDGISKDSDMSTGDMQAKVLENIQTMSNNGVDIVSAFTGDYAQYLSTLDNQSGGTFIDMKNTATTETANMANNVANNVNQIPGKVSESLNNAKNQASTGAQNVANAVDNGTANVSGKVKNNFDGVSGAVSTGLSGGTKAVDSNTKQMNQAVDKNTKNLAKTADTNFKAVDRSAKSSFKAGTDTVKREATNMYNGAKVSFDKTASNAQSSFSKLKSSIINQTAIAKNSAINNWNAIRDTYAKTIKGKIEVTKTEKTVKIVEKKEEGGKALTRASMMIDNDIIQKREAMSNLSRIVDGANIIVERETDKRKEKKEVPVQSVRNNKNITINNTYNAPTSMSVSELKRKSKTEQQRLALLYNI